MAISIINERHSSDIKHIPVNLVVLDAYFLAFEGNMTVR
jgi:hypothetical protein